MKKRVFTLLLTFAFLCLFVKNSSPQITVTARGGAGGVGLSTASLPLAITDTDMAITGLTTLGSAYQRMAMNAGGTALGWIYPNYLTASDGVPIQAVFVAANGNFGIDTIAPDGIFEINHGTNKEFRGVYNNADGTATDYYKFEIADDGMTTWTTVDAGGAEADICLMPDGDVGISTIAPLGKLHVEDVDTIVLDFGVDAFHPINADDADTSSIRFEKDALNHIALNFFNGAGNWGKIVRDASYFNFTANGNMYFNPTGLMYIKNPLPPASDNHDLGSSTLLWQDLYGTDEIIWGGKGQTAKWTLSKENSIAGTDSSMVLSVDSNGDGKIDVKGADGAQDFLVQAGNVTVGGSTTVTGETINVPGGDDTISDAGTIDVTGHEYLRVVSDDADATNVSLEDGTADGQKLELQGTADGNLVTITDGNNCQLAGGVNFSLGKGDIISLRWDAGDSDWYERFRSDN